MALGVVRDIDVETGVHLLIGVIRRGVFCRRDLVAELVLYLGLGLMFSEAGSLLEAWRGCMTWTLHVPLTAKEPNPQMTCKQQKTTQPSHWMGASRSGWCRRPIDVVSREISHSGQNFFPCWAVQLQRLLFSCNRSSEWLIGFRRFLS
jgi:hypothetical protein